MSEVNEILKEKFEISTESKSLEQVLNEMSIKWKTLDEDSQKELEELVVGERFDADTSKILPLTDLNKENIFTTDINGYISRKPEYSLNKLGIDIKNQDGHFKCLEQILQELAVKWDTDIIKERLADDDGTSYTTEDVIRMREEKKLEREFKAKDWI